MRFYEIEAGSSLTPDPSPAPRARGVPLPRASDVVQEAARGHRRSPTRSERLLWRALRDRQLGVKFRRQHPVGRFILDFYCVEERLAIEVDGGIHKRETDHDRARQRALESLGIRFLRLPADTVEHDTASTLQTIRDALTASPSPAHGRGAGGEG